LPKRIVSSVPSASWIWSACQKFLAQPDRHRHQERAEAAGRDRDGRLQQPLELDERLFVKRDVRHIPDADAGLAQTVRDGVRRKRRVVFLAREALFLRRSDNPAVTQQTRCGVVVIRGEAEDVNGVQGSGFRVLGSSRSEQRIDKRGDGTALGEDEKQAQQDQPRSRSARASTSFPVSENPRTLQGRIDEPWSPQYK